MGVQPRHAVVTLQELPFSAACENNKGPILEQLREVLADARGVLEIGSGTGQHAVWFAAHLPWLSWQPTEIPESLLTLRPRCQASGLDNLLPPRAMDVCDAPWPLPVPDAVFTANTLHIMPMASVHALFRGLAAHAGEGTRLLVYGPFNYDGQYTSASNARFDEWLRARSQHSGIRDAGTVDGLAREAGFVRQADHAMPANNRLMIWRRQDKSGAG